MDSVWVLLVDDSVNSDIFEGVFSSLEKAQDSVVVVSEWKCRGEDTTCWCAKPYTVLECQLDG